MHKQEKDNKGTIYTIDIEWMRNLPPTAVDDELDLYIRNQRHKPATNQEYRRGHHG